MQDYIEKLKDKKAQIAGEILEREDLLTKLASVELANPTVMIDTLSHIKNLEAHAELYDALIELAEAFEKLRESTNAIANLQKN